MLFKPTPARRIKKIERIVKNYFRDSVHLLYSVYPNTDAEPLPGFDDIVTGLSRQLYESRTKREIRYDSKIKFFQSDYEKVITGAFNRWVKE